MYLLLGLSSFLPIVHGVRLHGLEEHNRRMGLVYYVGLGLCHGTGAMLYAVRVPERWYPRRFDIVGSSHQLMHMLVICGAVCYGIGILRANEYWRGASCEMML
jgi:adiponectin receptor